MPDLIINIGDLGKLDAFRPKDAYILRAAKAQLNTQFQGEQRLCTPLELPAGNWVITAKAVMQWEPREDSGPVMRVKLRVYTSPLAEGASDEARVSLPLSKLGGGYEQEQIHDETATLLMAARLNAAGQVYFLTDEPRVKYSNIVISAIRVASLDASDG